ncbi:helix-turn-helix domain-containing protein [Micromonospora polyrhachis]|uniref:helix-turn-helix domain-containing protein n=1 Tax=Micromonospora polyrhachis TaxID=1282883 RepID=UPI001C869522|nr:helix-turn-helix transcriptional regulator [Micromonospora polyrhachis]
MRKRCATPEAAAYTLYVRQLIEEHYQLDGQATILRVAEDRGVLVVGFDRRSLSEQISGKYKRGPNWPTTEMVIRALPKGCHTEALLAHAAALYRRARKEAPPGYKGEISRLDDDPVLPEVPESGPPTVEQLQAKIARMRRRHHEETTGQLESIRMAQRQRRDADLRADQLETELLRVRELYLGARTEAAQLATLREECARLSVEQELLATPQLRSRRILELPELSHAQQRVRVGHLAHAIDPIAPRWRRALARYLCTYAEMLGITMAELSIRAGISPAVVQDTLTGRRAPTDVDLRDIGEVLQVHMGTALYLATEARKPEPSTSFEEITWVLPDLAQLPTLPPDIPDVVGAGSDNRASDSDTAPTAGNLPDRAEPDGADSRSARRWRRPTSWRFWSRRGRR